MNDIILVETSTETEADADRIAAHLVEKRLAACVHILGPIKSVYRWQGKVQREEEWLCVIKTKRDVWPQVEEQIKELHPYELPAMLITNATGGSPEYLSWIERETAPDRS